MGDAGGVGGICPFYVWKDSSFSKVVLLNPTAHLLGPFLPKELQVICRKQSDTTVHDRK